MLALKGKGFDERILVIFFINFENMISDLWEIALFVQVLVLLANLAFSFLDGFFSRAFTLG